MSFRKRSVVLSTSDSNNSNSTTTASTTSNAPQSTPPTPPAKGVRPSFLTGVPTTSTGTASLDALLSGHEGLPLGSMMLIEESSTTDFAGALLRYYAAEGIVQGHSVIVVGADASWGRELPGLSDRKEDNEDIKKRGKEERMKIAWRYEALGNRRTTDSTPPPQMGTDTSEPASLFCHTYDLTKRLTIPSSSKPPTYIPPPPLTSPSPFSSILSALYTNLSNASSANSITRVLIPNLLSPLFYPPSSSHPTHLLQFIHTLRSLTRQYSHILTIMISFPLPLYPRTTGLTRHLEHLSDATIELHPIPTFLARFEMTKSSSSSTSSDDIPQGLVKVWKAIEGKKGTGIVGSSSKGDGTGGVVGMEGGDDLAFMLTRRRMRIERFSLPVDEGDDGGEEHKVVHNPSSTVGEGVGGVETGRKMHKVDLEF